MPKRFLNVEYAGIRTRINIADFEDLSEVKHAIKNDYGPGMADVGAPQLQLYDQQGQHIQDLEDVPEDYFKKQRNGGLFLVIRTSPPPSRQASRNDLSESDRPYKRQLTELTELTQRLKGFTDSQIVDNCIQSQELLPYSQEKFKKLFVRKCYEDVFELLLAKVESGLESFAISGTPGIGKSMFFIYMLYRLIKDTRKTLPLKPNRIVYQVGSSFKCFDLQRKNVIKYSESEWDNLLTMRDTFYVIDGRNSEYLPSSCVSLFISSPRSEWYKEFVKQKKAYEWYFPVWTWEELETCWQLCYQDIDIHEVQQTYLYCGGVARVVFSQDGRETVRTSLETALEEADAVEAVKRIKNPAMKFENSHKLFHLTVSSDGKFRFLHLDVASKFVGEKLWQHHAAQMMTNLQQMYGGAPNEMSGYLFEIYGHNVFAAGGRTLQCRNLDDNTLTELTLDSLDGKRVTFRKNALPATLEHGYYEPAYDDTFPAIDALTPQGMFQFTVADEHPIRGVQTLRQLCNLYDQPKLYFVVPPHRFAKFKKQRFLATEGQKSVGEIPGLKQYVLELPVISASAPSVQ